MLNSRRKSQLVHVRMSDKESRQNEIHGLFVLKGRRTQDREVRTPQSLGHELDQPVVTHQAETRTFD